MSDVNDKSRRELLKATAAISAAGSLGLSMQSASASDTRHGGTRNHRSD